MKKILSALIITGLIFSILSCASTKKVPGSKISPVYITNSKKFYLISPEAIQKILDSQIMLDGSFGNKTFTLLSYVQADDSGIFISLFNDFGTGMGNLSYDGKQVSFESAVFPKKLKAEYVLADLQFAYYKPEAIQKTLSQIKMTLEVSESDEKEIRLVKNGNQIIEEIVRESNVVTITNKLRGYQYILTEADE